MLFCPKCGFTFPQVDATSASGVVAPGPPGARAAYIPGNALPPRSAYVPPPTLPTIPRTSTPYSTPTAPPPNGKYCIRCGTLIARPAVYCPVCQQPQGT
jgi:hypothetical protein